ncbi:MAG: ATP-binding protein [Actinomycetota bacterium]|nr:ATP-binding protein [Actinomycetota bacterium]
MPQTAARSEMILALEPRPESAGIVRRALHAQGLSRDVAHTVDLLATEVIANAVRHAELDDGQRIVFFARISDDFARVEIADPGPGFDPGGVSGGGYGLRLLGTLATRWGIECSRGCRIWFEVDRRSGRSGRFGRPAPRTAAPAA